MLPYKQIGSAWKTTSKKGTEYISISFDEEMLAKIHVEDLQKKVGMYENKYKKEDKHPDYILMAPVDDR